MDESARPARRLLDAARRYAGRKRRQLRRLSRKSLRFALLLAGAALVALVSMGFAQLADLALHWNGRMLADRGWLAFVVLPLGLVVVRWLTLKFAPNAVGSGIPQVIAALSLRGGPAQTRLVSLAQTLWKIPLTFATLLIGGSAGREGPSVQIGAGVMLAWGRYCQRRVADLRGFRPNELIAAGAAGGLAAAFNAPLAGVVFAIEELGRGTVLRWDRLVLLGVLAAGFMVVALSGNNPYFGMFGVDGGQGGLWAWALACGLVNGVLGGVFARLLGKGAPGLVPRVWRGVVRRRPLATAFVLGLAIAALGVVTGGAIYGTGYAQASTLLAGGQLDAQGFGLAKLLATVLTYAAGVPGGIFTPALTTGAGIGAHIGELAGAAADQRLLVLVSMAAFLAAATQSPLAASVVVMEMTGSQPMLFWLLAGSLVASVVSRQFCPMPFYHLAARRFRQAAAEPAPQAGQASTTQAGVR
jgi:Chloride channel protein EriC